MDETNKLLEEKEFLIFNKYETVFEYSIYNRKIDKTLFITKDNFEDILNELKKLDRDSVDSLFNLSTIKKFLKSIKDDETEILQNS